MPSTTNKKPTARPSVKVSSAKKAKAPKVAKAKATSAKAPKVAKLKAPKLTKAKGTAAAKASAAKAASARPSKATHISSTRVGDLRAGTTKAASTATQGATTRTTARAKLANPNAVKGSRKVLIAVVVAVALIFVLVIGYFVAYNSNAFEIEEVSVKGVEHLTSTDLQNLAGVEQGTTLLNVNTEEIREQLKRDAWVEDVAVNRVFPHTLELVVTERTIEAIVQVPSQDGTSTIDWAIASDGMWLMPIPAKDTEAGQLISDQVYEDAEDALKISDVPYTTKPEIGTYCSDDNVNNALSIVAGMTTELASRVTAVKATEKESTTLTIKDGPDIVFGTADDIREKERVCLQILEEHPDGVSYINVRSVDRPTYRAL